MDSRTSWSCLVDTQAVVLEWEDTTGAEYLASFVEVVRYAQALIYSKRDSLTFFYYKQEISLWFKVSLQRHKQHFTLLQVTQTDLPFELSHRELEILTLISSGLSNGEIAEQLYISERTVAKHVQHLFEKTAIENRTILAVFAVTENLCCLPTPGCLTHSILASYEIEQLAKKRDNFTKINPFSIKHQHTKPITIGIPYVEQGIGLIDTQELLNGSMLAVETINQQGGINGRELQLETAGFCVEDRESIRQAYQQLFDKEVDAISTNYACYSPEIHELVAMQGIPYLHIATHSTTNKLAQHLPLEKIENIFQVCASDVNYGLGIMRFLQSYQQQYPTLVKNKQLLIFNVKWQKIDIGVEQLILAARALKWSVEVVELEKSDQTFSYAMKQVHQLMPEIVVLASYFAEDILAFHQAFLQQPINAIIYSIYAPSVLLPHQQLCEGVVWASTTGLSTNHVGQQFRQQYQQLFGHQPSYSQASVAYDQVHILANTWQHSTSPRAFKEVLNGIRSLIYHGVNGTYYLGNDEQVGLTYPDNTTDLSISQPHLVFQIQQGKNTVIAPNLFAEAKFKLPPWFRF
ncbi:MULTISPECIES: ABC transporter substrate-binding protein [Glaesserella]|uniref:Amino acid ABC transporter n=1 Tax=Glaesserella australis TaxID=2094024 RepID=A0A328C3B1_9PAST|nr:MULTISPECIES: ABC transporter substrate-binding protein [Glaesserella]AUI65712.1 amino acid ABC transporter [Glaesserella sp. 15-184]RAL19004.1 amino acid ABC transporter [Glaesserella australis]